MVDPLSGQAPAASPGRSLAERLHQIRFPHPVEHLQLHETPISWVVLTGVYVYKIKKPVHFDFIDASTLQRRQFLCEEELRLNRRFAPDLYLDVVPIAEDHGQLCLGVAGTPIEYAVRMLQFDTSQELASRLAQGRVSRDDAGLLGKRIAELHRAAPVAAAADEFGRPEVVRAQVLENFGPLRKCLTAQYDQRLLDELEGWSQDTLGRVAHLLAQRRASARVRECHGDLHAGNIVHWKGRYQPFDCLEFDPRLRWIDVISDIAFLFMDLVSHARPDLGFTFLSAYLEDSGDYEGLRLLPLYTLYRALVRAKVDVLAVATATPDSAPLLRERLRARLNTAAQVTSAGAPALILMHGVTASGKSRVSEQLIAVLGAVRVRSDLERRRLGAADNAPQHPPRNPATDYSAAARRRTYARLFDCAQSALAGGCNVIIDATFLDAADRQMFEALGRRDNFPFLIVSCSAARATLAARLTARSQRADDPSEATLAVLNAQLDAAEPLSEQERSAAVQIDTDSASNTRAAIHTIAKLISAR